MKNLRLVTMTVLVSVSLLLGTLVVRAQDGTQDKRTAEEKAQHRTEVMKKDANLNDDQVNKVSAINLDAAKKMDAVKNDKSLSEDARKAKIKDIRKDAKNQLKGVLTPEQRKTLKAKRVQRKNIRQARPKTGGGRVK